MQNFVQEIFDKAFTGLLFYNAFLYHSLISMFRQHFYFVGKLEMFFTNV